MTATLGNSQSSERNTANLTTDEVHSLKKLNSNKACSKPV